MKDNLRKVGICKPNSQKLDRYVNMRVISGVLNMATGSIVTLARDQLPLKKRQYTVIGRDAEGVPLVVIK